MESLKHSFPVSVYCGMEVCTLSPVTSHEMRGNNVEFRMFNHGNVCCPDFKMIWTLKLQRYYNPPGGGWETIGERNGYLTNESPSTRTFTGVRALGNKLRLVSCMEEQKGKQMDC